jgi:flagellar hook-basal body complex protein FliE
MQIFNDYAYIGASKDYSLTMARTHPGHMLPPDSPYFGSGNKMLALEKKIGVENITGAGTFEQAMLHALDKVSGTQQFASELELEAMLNPDLVDVHDVTMAQAEARLALSITQNVLSRLVQGWRDLINTR